MFFSVIIPTCERLEHLETCLAATLKSLGQLNQIDYEIIVSDDGSSTLANDLIANKFPGVLWLKGPRNGAASNRNNGAMQAKGDWLLFVDDDCIPDLNWAKAYYEAIEQYPEINVFEGRTYPDRPRQSLAEEAPVNETGGHLWSCNFAIKREFFLRVGKFEERLRYDVEDTEFQYRLKNIFQASIQFIPSASVCHPWRISKGWVRYEKMIESRVLFYSMYPDKLRSITVYKYLKIVLGKIIFTTIPGLFKYQMRGFWPDVNHTLFFAKLYLKILILNYSTR
ncbi:MAG: glycosyltransferase family 2 protein [Synechococcales cyanobacterium]